MRTRIGVLTILGLLTLASCGDAGASGKLETITGQDVTVRMFDNRYEYNDIKVPVGGSVTWLGAGRNAHNAEDAGGTWSTESVFGTLDQYRGDEATITYDQPGVYPFFCSYHGNADGEGMAGVLTVGTAE